MLFRYLQFKDDERRRNSNKSMVCVTTVWHYLPCKGVRMSYRRIPERRIAVPERLLMSSATVPRRVAVQGSEFIKLFLSMLDDDG